MAGRHRKPSPVAPTVTAALGVTTAAVLLGGTSAAAHPAPVASHHPAPVAATKPVPKVTPDEQWLAVVPHRIITLEPPKPVAKTVVRRDKPVTRPTSAPPRATNGKAAVARLRTESAPVAPKQAPAPVAAGQGSGAAAKAVRAALAQRGVMYRYGGTTPAGFDCSGLVGYAYRKAGITLPRTSGALSRVGRTVPLSQVRAGDILYWPGHVAMAIGGGQLVESSTHGKPVATRAIYGTPLVKRVA